MRFNGTWHHSVDDKGRVSLPAKIRKELPEKVVVVPSLPGRDEDALFVFPEDAFNAWVDSFFPEEEGGYNPRSKNDVALRRYLNSNAETVAIDSVGRIKLSADKRALRGVEKDVAIIGDEDHIEIWDEGRYHEYMRAAEESIFEGFWED